MKNIILALPVLFSVQAFALDLRNPADFEYIHCVMTQGSSRQIVTHYVVDVREPQRYQLHSARAAQGTKASALQRLRLVDPMLNQAQAAGYDIVWKSAPNRVQFNLQIMDDGGQTLKGYLVSDRKLTEIACRDVTLE